ncbi:MAG: phosphoribosylglycinamide formyltransferase [Acidimicrobiia bacterium]
MVRLAVLASGSGTNLGALLEAAADPDYPCDTVLVLSDVPGCGALARAEVAGVDTSVVTWAGSGGDRAAFTAAIVDELRSRDVELVALAGFMRILDGRIVEAFPDAILNTHPSLLPAFRGAHAVEDALAAGVKVTGVTIHVVDDKVDHGPIVAQECVGVLDDDTPATLHDRIKTVEHVLFPRVVADWARGSYAVEGRRVRRHAVAHRG